MVKLEVIKELAEQANLEMCGCGCGMPTKQSLKFAELIVRECVRYFNEDYQRDFDTLWREDLTKGIKEHFGVKA